jgi:hypothetical protein
MMKKENLKKKKLEGVENFKFIQEAQEAVDLKVIEVSEEVMREIESPERILKAIEEVIVVPEVLIHPEEVIEEECKVKERSTGNHTVVVELDIEVTLKYKEKVQEVPEVVKCLEVMILIYLVVVQEVATEEALI